MSPSAGSGALFSGGGFFGAACILSHRGRQGRGASDGHEAASISQCSYVAEPCKLFSSERVFNAIRQFANNPGFQQRVQCKGAKAGDHFNSVRLRLSNLVFITGCFALSLGKLQGSGEHGDKLPTQRLR